MKTNVFVRDSRHVKYWWVSLIAGLLSILVGVLCLVTPDATLVALSMLFIAVLLVDGIMDIVLAASNSDMLRGWGWMLVTGIMELLLAIMLMVMPIGVGRGDADLCRRFLESVPRFLGVGRSL